MREKVEKRMKMDSQCSERGELLEGGRLYSSNLIML